MDSRRRVRWGGYGSAVLLLVVAVFGNQVLNSGVWSWPWLMAALVAALATAGWDRWRTLPQPAGTLRLADALGRPLRLDHVDLAQLGVNASRFAAPDRPAPHIARPIDGQLAAALAGLSRQDRRRSRVVVVQGERLAGATHALAQAARTHLPAWRVAAFEREQSLTLPTMVERAAGWVEADAGVVVWLDAISLDHLGDLTESLLAALPPRVVIMATVHTEEITGPGGEPAARPASHVLALLREHATHLTLGVITPGERDLIRAEPAYQALRPAVDEVAVEVLMGRLMVALQVLRQALTPDTSEQASDRVALLRAVVDWQRAQMPVPLTGKALRELWKDYRRHLSRLPPGAQLAGEVFTRALTWATDPASAGRPQLVSATGPYRPHPLLAVLAEEPAPVGWTISAPLWDYAGRHLTEGDLLKLGYTALDHGAPDTAARLLDALPVSRIAPSVLNIIALHFYDNHDLDAALHWWVKTVELNYPGQAPDAMIKLGILEKERGNLEQARRWWFKAIKCGHPYETPRAMAFLGLLDKEQEDLEQARCWWIRVTEFRHSEQVPTSMTNLGIVERERGQVQQSRKWFLRAIESRHPDEAFKAMVGLGQLEKEQGRLRQARHWWAKVARSGHPDYAPVAMVQLSFLEKEQGRVKQAHRWWIKAFRSGHSDEAPKAMVGLGLLEYGRGRFEEACSWLLQAIDTGHRDQAPRAMVCLGHTKKEQGQFEEACSWLLQAIDTDHRDEAPIAMNNLGALENTQGRQEEARRWYLKAIATGHSDEAPKAMNNLGELEHKRHVEEARSRFLEAIDTGHHDEMPRAMVCLGHVAVEQGCPEEARRWFVKAINSRHPDMADRARGELRDLERRAEEQRQAEWYGRYGFMGSATYPITAHPPDPPEDSEDSAD